MKKPDKITAPEKQLGIEITNCGPVRHITIPIQPGATVLRGTSNTGKSRALAGIERLLGGNSEVRPTYGEDEAIIEGIGLRLRVGGRTTIKGELEVEALEDRFGLSTLIDGDNIDDPARADAARIKALLRISGAKANPADFYGLLAGAQTEFDRLVKPESTKTEDPVELARRVKRDLDAAAGVARATADREEGAAEADRHAGEGLDLTAGETDPAKLQAAHTRATSEHAKLTTERDVARKTKAAAETARQNLVAAGAQSAVTLGNARKALETAANNRGAAKDAADQAKANVQRLEALLVNAKAAHGAALVALSAADEAVETAQAGIKAVEENAKAYAGWQSAIEAAASVTEPEAAEIIKAEAAVERTRKAIEQGAVIRAARARIAQAEAHAKAAEKARIEAARLSAAGKETDEVLSKLVASPNFKVRSGRLYVQVPGRGDCLYGEQSDGFRTKIGIKEKVARLRAKNTNPERLAVVVVSQRTYADLPPAVKEELIADCQYDGVCVLTAEADDAPEIHAEVRE